MRGSRGLALVGGVVGLVACLSGCSGTTNSEVGPEPYPDGSSEDASPTDATTSDGQGKSHDAAADAKGQHDATMPEMDAGGDAGPDAETAEGGGEDAAKDAPEEPYDAAGDAEDATSPGNDASSDAGGDAGTGADATIEAGHDGSSDAAIVEAASDAAADVSEISDANVPDVSLYDGSSGTCNSLTNSAPIAPENTIYGTLPAGTGGTIPLGLYHLTGITKYVTPDAGQTVGAEAGGSAQIRQTVEFVSVTGTTYTAAAIVNFQDGSGDQTFDLDAVVTSPSMAITLTCVSSSNIRPPGATTYTVDATATPLMLHIYQRDWGGPGVDAEQDYQLQ
jgi:hypothetical protein